MELIGGSKMDESKKGKLGSKGKKSKVATVRVSCSKSGIRKVGFKVDSNSNGPHVGAGKIYPIKK